jgi:hypothetical protein
LAPDKRRTLTPEEELLKIIENTQPEAQPQRQIELQKKFEIRSLVLSLFENLKIKGRILFVPKRIITVLKLAGVILAIYLVIDLGLVQRSLKIIPLLKSNFELSKPWVETGQKSPSVPVAFYKETLKKRNIFNLPISGEITPGAGVRVGKVGDLELVGIAWSEEPEAMIEDTKTGKTYFFKENQTFENIKVTKIYKDGVSLNIYGEEVELILK